MLAMKAELISFDWTIAPRHPELMPDVPGAWMAHTAMMPDEAFSDFENCHYVALIADTEEEVVADAFEFHRNTIDYPDAATAEPCCLADAPVSLLHWVEAVGPNG